MSRGLTDLQPHFHLIGELLRSSQPLWCYKRNELPKNMPTGEFFFVLDVVAVNHKCEVLCTIQWKEEIFRVFIDTNRIHLLSHQEFQWSE